MRAILVGVVLYICLGPEPAFARHTCNDFSTCEEAMKAYKAGNTRLDGDKDGIPCEKLFGN